MTQIDKTDNGSFDAHAALLSLGIKLSDATSKALADNVAEARTAAVEVAEATPDGAASTDPKVLLKALEANKQTEALVGDYSYITELAWVRTKNEKREEH